MQKGCRRADTRRRRTAAVRKPRVLVEVVHISDGGGSTSATIPREAMRLRRPYRFCRASQSTARVARRTAYVTACGRYHATNWSGRPATPTPATGIYYWR